MYQYPLPVANTSLDALIGEFEPSCDFEQESLLRADVELRISRLSRIEQRVVNYVYDGYSFHQAAIRFRVSNSEVYKIKRKLMSVFADLQGVDQQKLVRDNVNFFQTLVDRGAQLSRDHLSLSEFSQIHVNDYDPESDFKGWRIPAFADVMYQNWLHNQKSVTLAPREHLKTTTTIDYIIKRIFERQYPIEVDYFGLNDDLAIEKVMKLRGIIERNPLLAANFGVDDARNWSDKRLMLRDGSVIMPLSYQTGSIGKHPHIIVMDDVIDMRVMYSDRMNQKSIDRFYSMIYPMITKMDEGKQIIVIGTVQRKDDLYHALPPDFKIFEYGAIVDEEKKLLLMPEKYSWSDMMTVKQNMIAKHGEKFWLKEYMNKPFEALGLIVKPEWIQTYNALELNAVVDKREVMVDGKKTEVDVTLREKLAIYDGWDLSVGKDIEKGDWTCGVRIGIIRNPDKIKIYILKVVRKRVDFDGRLRAIVDLWNEGHCTRIGVEEQVFQYDTVQTLKKHTLMPVVGVKALTNKIESFQVELAPYFENGQIYVEAGMQDFITEILSLPVGEFDDQADGLKIAIKTALLQAQEPRIRSFA